jgi:hypothetical protein
MGGWDPNGSQGDWLEAVEWFQFAQDSNLWRLLVNTVMYFPVLVPRS